MEGKGEERWPAEPAEPGPRRKQGAPARRQGARSPRSPRREPDEPEPGLVPVPVVARKPQPARTCTGQSATRYDDLAGWGEGGGKAGRAEAAQATRGGKAGPCQPSREWRLTPGIRPERSFERESTTSVFRSCVTVTPCWQFPASVESSRVISWKAT